MTSIPQSRWHRRTPPLEVQVVSLDWKWLFIYPDQGVASVNQLVVPVGVPVHFSLTSASVMNAFFVPQLGSMIYTMNGMTTQLNLQADEPGTFRGHVEPFQRRWLLRTCTSTCMAVPAEQFAAWIEATRNAGPTLDAGELRGPGQAEHEDAARSPSVRSSPTCFTRSSRRSCRLGPARGRGGPIASVSPRTEH